MYKELSDFGLPICSAEDFCSKAVVRLCKAGQKEPSHNKLNYIRMTYFHCKEIKDTEENQTSQTKTQIHEYSSEESASL